MLIFTDKSAACISQPSPFPMMPGMPAPITEQQLRASLQATTANIASMRHQGPQAEQLSFPTPGQPSNSATHAHGQTPYAPPLGGVQALSLTNQAPTIYVKYCNKCSWSSIPTTDGAAYAGAVIDLQDHKKEAHPEAKESGDYSINFKDSEDYKQATSLRDVEACKDDGVNNFCPVRFWRGPMSWKNSQLALPLTQTPVCGVGDFEPFGIEVNNRKLLKDIHYLGCKSLKLSDFSDVNLRLVPSQQDTFVGLEKGHSGRIFTKKVLKEISNVKESIKAVSNYNELMRMIHPLYSGPPILFKVRLLFMDYIRCTSRLYLPPRLARISCYFLC